MMEAEPGRDSTTDLDRALARARERESEGRLLEAVELFAEVNRLRRDAAVERHLVRLRRAAFACLDRSQAAPEWPPAAPPDTSSNDGPPIISPSELTAGRLRNGILRHGSLLVRGLVPATRVRPLRDAVDRAFEAFDAAAAGGAGPENAVWYDPLDGICNPDLTRSFARAGGAVLAADSPRALHEFLEAVREAGIDKVLGGYFDERPALSVEKTTLRRVDARWWQMRCADWHQDGAFLGAGIRTVDVWISLSRCGRDAPGMDIIPIRVDQLLATGDDGTNYDWSVSMETIDRAFPGVPIWRPEFEPGDVMFFDDRCLHRTAAELGMPHLRYAIESWFFAASVYPTGTSTPLVV